MKNYITHLTLALLAGATLLSAQAGELQWHTDLAKAQAQAKAEKKLVLLNFTGSDWCGWCIKLQREVFSKPEFEEFAKKNLVLVEVDFPSKKQQSAELKKANQALQKKYNITGFPTLVVLDGQGNKVGQLGYVAGGPKAWIEKFESSVKKS